MAISHTSASATSRKYFRLIRRAQRFRLAHSPDRDRWWANRLGIALLAVLLGACAEDNHPPKAQERASTSSSALPYTTTSISPSPSPSTSTSTSTSTTATATAADAQVIPEVKKHNHTAYGETEGRQSGKRWLAGDHHIHSRFSVGWDTDVNPPAPIIAGDAHYSTAMNAQMAYLHGLSWMVTTDHGGPNHSKLNLERAYPDLLASRKAVPGIIQFYGMELDTPGARHSSLIIPHSGDEAERLYFLEKTYNRREVYPKDPARDTEAFMLEALKAMREIPNPPLVLANHPGRTATDLGQYTSVSPTELRNWNDTAPRVAVGMEGAPGHQASALNPDASLDPTGARGGYGNYPTMGGFDQMTARVGGFWDSMLGEGRHWWITSDSDSHVHYTEGGADFWPGEFSKTYVYAEKNYHSILQALRGGHVFVTTGDLLSELYVSAAVEGKTVAANIGDTLRVEAGDSVRITVKFLDPDTENAHWENPHVSRVDVITGAVTGRLADKSVDTNPSTEVAGRYHANAWRDEGPYKVFSFLMENVSADAYVRIRGTSGRELEPEPDPPGEDPWSDLWFYSNPVFIDVK